jgi:hypothetical protein
MSERDRTLWPFRPKASIVAAVLILLSLLLTLVILRGTLDWPSPESETAVLLGIFLLSLTPILLVVADTIIERRGVVKFGAVKVDFSQAKRTETPGLTVPANFGNVGVLGQAVAHSGTNEILDALRHALRHATTSDSVIIDLEEGHAWWETRLLVLIAGAVRHKQPRLIVFVGTDGGVRKCFQGWAFAGELLPHLLIAHPKYPHIYHSALAAARQWEMVEAQEPKSHRSQPAWMQQSGTQPGLAGRHIEMAFNYNSGLPNPFFAEQLLASELGEEVEQAEPPRTISLVRLADLFRPVLHQEAIVESWPSERQLNVFFSHDAPYVALTEKGQFKALVSRLSVLNTMVGALVTK